MSGLPQDSKNTNAPVGQNKDKETPTPQPQGPEGRSFTENLSEPEKRKKPETIASPENIPTPQPHSQENAPAPESTDNASTASDNHPPQIVDKTDQITTLHEINQPKDRLTEEADEEEERFIEEVEKHHGR